MKLSEQNKDTKIKRAEGERLKQNEKSKYIAKPSIKSILNKMLYSFQKKSNNQEE